MEHRWGMRRTLDVGVTLCVGSKLPQAGRLQSASSSGAYVATSAELPVMSQVHVVLGWDGDRRGGRIPAYVVRADERGIGIEWQEFAPPFVLALLNTPQAPLARMRVPISPAAIRSVARVPTGPYLTFSRSRNALSSARSEG